MLGAQRGRGEVAGALEDGHGLHVEVHVVEDAAQHVEGAGQARAGSRSHDVHLPIRRDIGRPDIDPFHRETKLHMPGRVINGIQAEAEDAGRQGNGRGDRRGIVRSEILDESNRGMRRSETVEQHISREGHGLSTQQTTVELLIEVGLHDLVAGGARTATANVPIRIGVTNSVGRQAQHWAGKTSPQISRPPAAAPKISPAVGWQFKDIHIAGPSGARINGISRGLGIAQRSCQQQSGTTGGKTAKDCIHNKSYGFWL
ncbi:MAG: hypothetical protein QM813_14450 [Verrucomicrobiota bacterium]